MIWTKEMIQAELQRLDGITGLKGAQLPIELKAQRGVLGSFRHTKAGVPLQFVFSTYYLDDPEFSRSQAYDLIRHEYAHYMDLALNGAERSGGHGEGWKQCCREIGAAPGKYYNHDLNAVQLRHEKDHDKVARYMKLVEPGIRLRHPAFGEGVLLYTEEMQGDQRMVIRFNGESKSLNARWVFANCKLIREKE